MPTPTGQLLSRTSYAGDGVTTAWNFTFASGYLDKSHVKAYTTNPLGVRTALTITPASFVGDYQLTITPAIPIGTNLTIYRDTPKDAPLVNFNDGGALTEVDLDTVAKQAVFCAAESQDSVVIDIPAVLTAAATAGSRATEAAGYAAAAAVSAYTANASQADSSTSKTLAQTAALTCQTIASGLAAGFGFDATVYDFGSVADPVTYYNLDLGTL